MVRDPTGRTDDEHDNHGSHYEGDIAQSATEPGVARPHRLEGIRHLVSVGFYGAVSAGRPAQGADHLSRLRAPEIRPRHRENRAGAAILLPVAPQRRGSEPGLLEGAHDARG